MAQESTLTIRAQRSDDQDELFLLLTNEAALLDSVELPYMTEESFRDRFSNPHADTHVLIAESVLPSARRRIVGAAWLHVFTNRLRHTARLTLLCLPQHRHGDHGPGVLGGADRPHPGAMARAGRSGDRGGHQTGYRARGRADRALRQFGLG